MGGFNADAFAGSTGGTSAASTGGTAAGSSSGGMSGGLAAGLGIGAMVGGGLLNYAGEVQGAKAMQREADRQAAEQQSFSQQRHAALLAELGRYNPEAQQQLAQYGLQRSMAASQPALAAGGAALGLGAGQVASAGRALMPVQRLQANQGAAAQDAQRADLGLAHAGSQMAGVDRSAQLASGLYGAQTSAAGQRGAGLRLAGQTLGAMGMPLLAYGMNQPAGEAQTNWAAGKPVEGSYTETAGQPTQYFQRPAPRALFVPPQFQAGQVI